MGIELENFEKNTAIFFFKLYFLGILGHTVCREYVSRSIFKRGGGVFQMPEHPTNLTFGSVWEEKDRCVLIALG